MVTVDRIGLPTRPSSHKDASAPRSVRHFLLGEQPTGRRWTCQVGDRFAFSHRLGGTVRLDRPTLREAMDTSG